MKYKKLGIKKWFVWAAVILWMIGIFMFSNETAQQSTKRSGLILKDIKQSGFSVTRNTSIVTVRKSAHFGLYFVLGVLVMNLVLEYQKNLKKAAGLSLLVSFLYAVSDEVHQLFIRGRSSEVRDVVIDTVGSLLGILMFLLVLYLVSKYRSQNGKVGVVESGAGRHV